MSRHTFSRATASLWDRLLLPFLAALLGGLLTVAQHADEAGGDDDDDDDGHVGGMVVTLPRELTGSLGKWKCFRPTGKAHSLARSGPEEQPRPYTLRNEERGSQVSVGSQEEAALPQPVEKAAAAILAADRVTPWGGQRLKCLGLQEGHVVVTNLATLGSAVYCRPDGSELPQRLGIPPTLVNSALLVDGHLWLGCGNPLDDPLSGDEGWIVEFTLEAGAWTRTRLRRTEQAVFQMCKGDGDDIFVLCRSLILRCSREFRIQVVYGQIGYARLPDCALAGRATWRSFAENVSFGVLKGNFFIGTPYGLVVLAPFGTGRTEVYSETWIVPPEAYPVLASRDVVTSPVPFRFEGESLEERARREGWLQPR